MRERAIEAGARLISEQGLAVVTMEAVAEAAGCSVYSLYAAFGGRDELLGYSPILDLESLTAEPQADLAETVREIYAALVAAFTREPRVAPAMLADLFSRPDGPTGRIFQRYFPRVLDSVGSWLAQEVQAGRIRPLPVPLLIQQLIAPLVVHLLLRPAIAHGMGWDLPSLEETSEIITQAFLRAVGAAR